MKYQPFLIQKFLGILIQRGNRFKALNFFFDLLGFLKQDVQQKPINQLSQVINKLKPVVSYKKLRRGSKVIYLPKLLSYENQLKQAIN